MLHFFCPPLLHIICDKFIHKLEDLVLIVRHSDVALERLLMAHAEVVELRDTDDTRSMTLISTTISGRTI